MGDMRLIFSRQSAALPCAGADPSGKCNASVSGVTADYSHGYPLQKKLELLTIWSNHVEKLIGGDQCLKN
jgi:hypothetical protein